MTRNEWIEQAKTKIDTWNLKVEELEARAASLKEEVKADYKEALAEAREHVGHAEAQLAKARDLGTDAWSDTEDTLQKAWESEKETIETAFEKVKA